MGVTFVSGDARRRRTAFGALRRHEDRLLVAVAVVVAFAIALAYLGRVRAFQWPAADSPAVVTNLNEVTDPAALDAPLASILEHAADRQLAARKLVAFVAPGGDRQYVPNVGALLQARVPAADIDSDTRRVA